MSPDVGRAGRARGPMRLVAVTSARPEPSQRQLRVGEQIRHILAEVFTRGEVHDPRLQGRSLTVGEVRMSRDLRQATVYAAELGAQLAPETLAALRACGAVARQSRGAVDEPRNAPRLRFVADQFVR